MKICYLVLFHLTQINAKNTIRQIYTLTIKISKNNYMQQQKMNFGGFKFR
ncbi:hypothetical protein AtEden1_Chr1g0038911 [Arabidopsis thaliana]